MSNCVGDGCVFIAAQPDSFRFHDLYELQARISGTWRYISFVKLTVQLAEVLCFQLTGGFVWLPFHATVVSEPPKLTQQSHKEVTLTDKLSSGVVPDLESLPGRRWAIETRRRPRRYVAFNGRPFQTVTPNASSLRRGWLVFEAVN
ncbi:unnamed protein product [Protopolystoma xenopodis]|uniref:Uncharacterized protein n=1 Tax=Protopolystoma xenopodis TaxID=117903 RepID=A0A448XQN4_9PLAT|nr:unnamed protein product [Protopolystoma xenopodis]